MLRANEEPSLTAGDTRKAWAFVRTQPERIAAHVAEAKGRARKQLLTPSRPVSPSASQWRRRHDQSLTLKR